MKKFWSPNPRTAAFSRFVQTSITVTVTLTLSSILASIQARAIEPKNPIPLCERFISPQTKSACEKRLDTLGPDWYLAGVCEKQFEDDLFYSCLELSKSYNFAPDKLEKCDQTGIPDKERITCLMSIGEKESSKLSQVYQGGTPHQNPRLPASQQQKKSKVDRPHTLPQKVQNPAATLIGNDPN